MGETLCVRVDFYSDGRIVPISFKQNNETTKFVRKVQQIWYANARQPQEVVEYSCLLTDNTTVVMRYQGGKWFI